MKNTLRSNLTYSVAYQILIQIVPFITTPYVSRVLLPEGIGAYSVTTAIAKYFWLFALLGMSNYGNREISRVRDDKDRLSVSFWNLLYFQAIASTLILLIYLAYVFTAGVSTYGIVSLCQIPYVLSAVFEVGWFFYGLEQFKSMVIRNSTIKLLAMASIFIFVKTRNDVWRYALINASSLLLGQVYLWSLLRKYVHFEKPNWRLIRGHIRPNCVLFVSVAALSLYTLLNKILLGALSTNTEVGYFESTEKIMNMCNGIIGSIGMVMLPRVTHAVACEGKETIKAYLDKSIKYIMILTLGISFGVAGIGIQFSPVFFGREFEPCGFLLTLIAPAIMFYAWGNTLRTQYLLPNNRDKIYVTGTIVAAITNIALNLTLIPRFGAVGAVIATVSAQLTEASFQSISIRREVPFRRYVLLLLQSLCFSVVMFIYCRAIGRLLGASVSTLYIQIVGGVLIYGTLNFIYLLYKRDLLAMRIKRFLQKAISSHD